MSRMSLVFALLVACMPLAAAEPFLEAELLSPLEHWHNHSSSTVETPGGGLFVVWFHGSGERTAADVLILGARKAAGATEWSKPFVVADRPDFPDTNCTMFIDQQQRLWLFWPTIIANEWHTALMNFKVSSDYERPGQPSWQREGNLLLKHDMEAFEKKVRERVMRDLRTAHGARLEYLHRQLGKAGDKYFSRMGWMTRTHPMQLASGKMLVPLYSDGYDFSLVALSDDNGETWHPSEPLVGYGSIQPSILQRKDGTLVAYMRDNGPAPKRIHVSTSPDEGETWTRVVDTELPNPGASVEGIVLDDGRWLLVYNDLERGRNSLAVSLSDDEGKTWKWTRHLELDERATDPTRFHYPSMIQGRDGSIHVTYSYFLEHVPSDAPRKSIKHAKFNVEWVVEGE
jgi:predicted neuraminidase